MNKSKMNNRSFGANRNERSEGLLVRLFQNQRFLAFLLLSLVVLLAFPLVKTYTQKKVIENEMAQIEAEILKYEKETEELQKMIDYLGSQESLEAQARMNLNLKKPGETVVVIEREADILNEESGDNQEEDDLSNLKKWKKYFFASSL